MSRGRAETCGWEKVCKNILLIKTLNKLCLTTFSLYILILYNTNRMSHMKGITAKFLIYDFLHTLLSHVRFKTQPNQMTCINNQTNIQEAPPPGMSLTLPRHSFPLHCNGLLHLLSHLSRTDCPSFLSTLIWANPVPELFFVFIRKTCFVHYWTLFRSYILCYSLWKISTIAP